MKRTITSRTKKKTANRHRKYELLKSMLILQNLTPDEYEKKLKDLCNKMNI